MNQAQCVIDLFDAGAVRVGQFTLASGKTSSVYIDLRVIISYPALLKQVSEMIWHQIKSLPCDVLCGVPYTALPIATTISILHDKPMVMVRKEAKTYGTKKLIEGAYQTGDRCIVIEDLVTTGGSVIKAAEQLKAEGLTIQDVVVLIDREQGGRAQVEAAGFHLHAAFKISEILTLLKTQNKLTVHEWQYVELFLKELVS